MRCCVLEALGGGPERLQEGLWEAPGGSRRLREALAAWRRPQEVLEGSGRSKVLLFIVKTVLFEKET